MLLSGWWELELSRASRTSYVDIDFCIAASLLRMPAFGAAIASGAEMLAEGNAGYDILVARCNSLIFRKLGQSYGPIWARVLSVNH